MGVSDVRKNLKDLMEVTGWTKAELARQLDIARPTVYSWLNGKNVPGKEAADFVAYMLDQKRSEKESSGSEAENLRREIAALSNLIGRNNLRSIHKAMMSMVKDERFPASSPTETQDQKSPERIAAEGHAAKAAARLKRKQAQKGNRQSSA